MEVKASGGNSPKEVKVIKGKTRKFPRNRSERKQNRSLSGILERTVKPFTVGHAQAPLPRLLGWGDTFTFGPKDKRVFIIVSHSVEHTILHKTRTDRVCTMVKAIVNYCKQGQGKGAYLIEGETLLYRVEGNMKRKVDEIAEGGGEGQ